jgi:ATP-dependent DNA helicase DinG
MEEAAERFSPRARTAARSAIADAGGNEVFLLGSVESGKIAEVRVLARGNRATVPAILKVPRPGEVVIHNHPAGSLTPSEPDIRVASALGAEGVGSFIVDNRVERVYVVVEPFDAGRSPAISADDAAHFLGPDGPIARTLEQYEHRAPQLEMLGAVVRAFNDDEILTVEAGTGTGKSLAYLVPAILWARANGERVIVSTHTINLQEQLVHKDLPLLVERAGLECTTALVKGRGNYLCRRKATQVAEQQASLVEDELAAELRQLLDWAKRTNDGSLADLAERPRPEVWEQVVSENDNCLRARCPYYSTCFFYTARRAAAAADVLVANHHLLMADLALRDETENYTQNAVLPPATRLVIDEAHHLDDVATSYFGVQASLASLERPLSRLQSRRNPGRGVLPALQLALGSLEWGEDILLASGALRRIDDRLLPGCRSLVVQAEESFAGILAGVEPLLAGGPGGEARPKLRITAEVRDTAFWSDAVGDLMRLAAAADSYALEFGAVLERIEQLSEGAGMQVRYLATEVGALAGRVARFGAALLAFTADEPGFCSWIELRRSRTGPSVSLHTAPIEVGPLLSRALFEPFRTTVLTSATLAVNRSFDHLHDRLGLAGIEPRERVTELRIESPFDFERQAVLFVPIDLPEPPSPSYEEATHAAIRRALLITGGGTFVLFTAYGALNRAYAALEAEMTEAGLMPLRQGDTSRHHLLARFTRNPRAVLFATDSFWEGVDVKGDALRCVIIARLPFKVPTEPIEQARVEAIEERGGNAFLEHTVPQAVIKLKQGFGRLIRSRTDRGSVLVLDSRIARKRYGEAFLASLPPARRVLAGTEQIFAEMAAFHGKWG